MSNAGGGTATVRVSNVPPAAVASELLTFLSSAVGSPAVACDIPLLRRGWLPRSTGPGGGATARVQFDSPSAASEAVRLSLSGELPPFRFNRLDISPSGEDVVHVARDPGGHVEDVVLVAGNRVGEKSMEVFESWNGIRAEIMPERNRIDLFIEYEGNKYKLEVMFGDIIGSFGSKLSSEDGSDAVLLQLKYAPRIYCAIDPPESHPKNKSERYYVCREELYFQCIWIRSPDFTPKSAFSMSSSLLLKLKDGSSLLQLLKILPFSENLGDLTLVSVEEFECNSSCIDLFPLINCPSGESVPYEIFFQINSLIHMQKLPARLVNSELFTVLNGLPLEISLKILQKMHKLSSMCFEPVQYVRNQVATTKRNSKNLKSSESRLMHCYRAQITPTKVYLHGPELENSNYIVKHFAEYASDFVRVSFVDEDWSKLPANAVSTRVEKGLKSKPQRTGIYHRILSILRDGFSIGPKKFEFLAFSASQLRSNSVWMFASNENITAANIREFMGRFEKIRSVSKCAARMGQLFSSSTQTLDVPTYEIRIIPDIEITGPDGNNYNFSDGIGKISLSFARQIAQKLGLSHVPSAFQIRYGGFKGVVSVDRGSFNKLSLRNSMKKFESQSTMLNITKSSDYQPSFLNREIITLLSTLGIKDETFESLQRDHIRLLDEMLTSKESALKTVRRMSGGDSKTLIKMLMEGYEPSFEPYLSMILRAHREYQLIDIKTKCKIFVPKGRVLIGCLDGTGKLEYGQVYVRVSLTKEELRDKGEEQGYFSKIDDRTGVVVGKVIVTKNPCLHPGDVRVLDAVSDAELDDAGLVDCVVFPQKGKRPHPNECSGGDLDGDLYFISWDERLVPEKMETPMDYLGPRRRILDHDVSLGEIQKFFVDYMINDTLGAISTAHLVHADRELMKALSIKCLHLAQLHSMAVDFAKTGSPAEMPIDLKPRQFPDFMERYDKPSYTSISVLGKLYRSALNYLQNSNNETNEQETHRESISYDFDLEVPGFEKLLEDAEGFYEMYHEKFTDLMCYYGAEGEDEIVTGNLRNKSNFLKRDNKRYGELKDRILVGFRGLQREAEGWLKTSCAENEAARMASAWYHVVYHADFRAKNWGRARFLSFAWVNCEILLSVKAAKRHKRKLEELLEEGMKEVVGTGPAGGGE